METINQLNELKILIESRVPLLQIETTEEVRLLKFLEETATEKKWDLYAWTVTFGLKKLPEMTSLAKTEKLKDALQYIKDTPKSGIFVLLDYQPHLSDLISQRLIKESVLNRDVDGKSDKTDTDAFKQKLIQAITKAIMES